MAIVIITISIIDTNTLIITISIIDTNTLTIMISIYWHQIQGFQDQATSKKVTWGPFLFKKKGLKGINFQSK